MQNRSSRHSVMVISDTYPPVVGGAEFDVQRVCAELLRRGHRVLVLCAGGDPMPAVKYWLDPLGVPVRILTRASTGRAKHILFALRVAWHLWRERSRYEIAYFSMQGLHLATGLLTARLTGKRILMKVHGSTVIPAMSRSRMGSTELRWLRLWASKVLLLNDEMFEEAVAEGFRREQLQFMPNPIDVERFRPASPEDRLQLRTELGIDAEAFVIVYVGRLSPEKGVDWLLESFAKAAPQVPGAQLLFVGDGPVRASLERRALELGLSADRVWFVGRVPNEEVPRWLRAANTFALVSPNEGFSCALAEAMASGLASVVSDIPANSQLVEESIHGSLVQAGDIAATAVAFEGQARDLAVTQAMGARARQRVVDHYSTSRVVDQYEALFAEITHSGDASR